MKRSVYAIATMDTKGRELAFLADQLRSAGVSVVIVDVGTRGPPAAPPDVDRTTVAACHPDAGGSALPPGHGDRGMAIGSMSRALERYLLSEHEKGRVSGVIGIGG